MPHNNFIPNTATGLSLALLTALLWGILPIALTAILASLDGVTITWFRFTLAALICFLWQAYRGRLNEFSALAARDWGILTLAGLFLIADYVGFTIALNYISPVAATVLSQATPFFLCIGGIIIFKERLNRIQILCFMFLFVGLLFFFNDAFTGEFSHQKMLFIGAIVTVLSSLVWVFYALIQKSLLKTLSATNILLYIYSLAIVVLGPLSDLNGLFKLAPYDWLVLIFCAFNTIIAYGAFAQSMKHIETTKVSVIIATIPLITIAISYISFLNWPEYFTFENLNILGWVGISVVIASVVIFNQADKNKTSEIGT